MQPKTHLTDKSMDIFKNKVKDMKELTRVFFNN